MRKFWIAVAVTVGLTGASALAQETIRERQKTQQKRIGEGAASGELNKQEVKKLEKEQARINRKIARDKADGGGLTAKEKAQITHKQNQASKNIAKEKHDKQNRK